MSNLAALEAEFKARQAKLASAEGRAELRQIEDQAIDAFLADFPKIPADQRTKMLMSLRARAASKERMELPGGVYLYQDGKERLVTRFQALVEGAT